MHMALDIISKSSGLFELDHGLLEGSVVFGLLRRVGSTLLNLNPSRSVGIRSGADIPFPNPAGTSRAVDRDPVDP